MTMFECPYRHLDDASWSEFRQDLLAEKGGLRQRNFLESVKDRTSFLQEMDTIQVVDGEAPPIYDRCLTQPQFTDPDARTESRLYEIWEPITISVASNTAFWANVTLTHVREKRIKPTYLAANGIAGQSGAERLDLVLRSNEDNASEQLDRCVRSVIRQIGGIPQARGNKSLYVDCPFARAWWRERLLRRVVARAGADPKRLGVSLRQTKGHWEKFVAATVSRTPVFGLDYVQDAVVVALATLVDPKTFKSPSIDLIQRILQGISVLAGTRELGVLEYEEVYELISNVVARHAPGEVFPLD